MVGSYDIVVGDFKVQYEFTVKRKYTYIDEDISFNKTPITLLIEQYMSGSRMVYVESKLALRVASALPNLVSICKNGKRELVIIDNLPFVNSKAFAEIVKNTDKYFFIISRKRNREIPDSMCETCKFSKYSVADGKIFYKSEVVQ